MACDASDLAWRGYSVVAATDRHLSWCGDDSKCPLSATQGPDGCCCDNVWRMCVERCQRVCVRGFAAQARGRAHVPAHVAAHPRCPAPPQHTHARVRMHPPPNPDTRTAAARPVVHKTLPPCSCPAPCCLAPLLRVRYVVDNTSRWHVEKQLATASPYHALVGSLELCCGACRQGVTAGSPGGGRRAGGRVCVHVGQATLQGVGCAGGRAWRVLVGPPPSGCRTLVPYACAAMPRVSPVCVRCCALRLACQQACASPCLVG